MRGTSEKYPGTCPAVGADGRGVDAFSDRRYPESGTGSAPGIDGADRSGGRACAPGG